MLYLTASLISRPFHGLFTCLLSPAVNCWGTLSRPLSRTDRKDFLGKVEAVPPFELQRLSLAFHLMLFAKGRALPHW